MHLPDQRSHFADIRTWLLTGKQMLAKKAVWKTVGTIISGVQASRLSVPPPGGV